MKLVVGLGNIGEKYKLNRHNVGFLVLDYLISNLNASKISSKFKGELFKNKDFLFLKPSTFMNLSGESVLLVKNYYNLNLEDIIVIHDDIDLKLGALKFKKGGSSGGHNGIKSIDKLVGKDYYRIRIGISRPSRKEDVVNYVLSDFTQEELDCIESRYEVILQAIQDIEHASRFSKKEC